MRDESSRTHDVVVSYSSKDKKWADAACSASRSQSRSLKTEPTPIVFAQCLQWQIPPLSRTILRRPHKARGATAVNPFETLPAPVLPFPPEDKFRSEQRAFNKLFPELLPTHRDQYVAIHGRQVVASGADQIEVAERAYALFGYIPILVTLVTDQPRPVIRIRSPRLVGDRDSHDAILLQPPG
jgi:Family of unknown function (DUF5678)